MAVACFAVMLSLGEMGTYLPTKKGFSGYATRFVDPAMGFALGWIYLIKYLIVTPNNIGTSCSSHRSNVRPPSLTFLFSPSSSRRFHRRPVLDQGGSRRWLAHSLARHHHSPQHRCVSRFFLFSSEAFTYSSSSSLYSVGVRVFGEIEFWMSFIKVRRRSGCSSRRRRCRRRRCFSNLFFGLFTDLPPYRSSPSPVSSSSVSSSTSEEDLKVASASGAPVLPFSLVKPF
jgi:hypothetical protein